MFGISVHISLLAMINSFGLIKNCGSLENWENKSKLKGSWSQKNTPAEPSTKCM
jgi:hypothetical protein